MLSVIEARDIVLRHARPLTPRRAALDAAALGRVLAEDAVSDLDMPPFDKALMDGYAIRSSDLIGGRAELSVIEEVTAGRTPSKEIVAGTATRITTGSPIPRGSDAVVPWEQTEQLDSSRIRVKDETIKPGRNVMPRGREMRRGEVVVPRGAVLRPQEFGVLATVGRPSVLLHPAPEVAILATGDEIVDASQVPGPGQIRNGNAAMLLAQVVRAGGVPRPLGIARDTMANLRPMVEDGLRSPVLILSGGVSAGSRDFVPMVLKELGVEAHFQKVEMKPGKPVLFGTRGDGLVFGLPGNPVSALVCFELFVRPALRRLAGHADADPLMNEAILASDFAYRTDRPTYHPARLELTADGLRVTPVPWFGSPDLRGLVPSNGFVVLPVGDHRHRAGQRLPVLRVEE